MLVFRNYTYGVETLHTIILAIDCRFNELALRWTASETWVFSRQFNISSNSTSQDNVDLLLTGVDTVADIFIDDTLVRSTYNAHRCGGC